MGMILKGLTFSPGLAGRKPPGAGLLKMGTLEQGNKP